MQTSWRRCRHKHNEGKGDGDDDVGPTIMSHIHRHTHMQRGMPWRNASAHINRKWIKGQPWWLLTVSACRRRPALTLTCDCQEWSITCHGHPCHSKGDRGEGERKKGGEHWDSKCMCISARSCPAATCGKWRGERGKLMTWRWYRVAVVLLLLMLDLGWVKWGGKVMEKMQKCIWNNLKQREL